MIEEILGRLGVTLENAPDSIAVHTPIDGSMIGTVRKNTIEEIETKIVQSVEAFKQLRDIPAPKRGEMIRQFGNVLRDNKEDLAQLVTIECGKIIEEGRGEVQEMIDICDFAVGLSRQLYGLTITSERPQHTMQENWLPIGPVGIISAFNFPVAVWAWNFALAVVCGNPTIWKPSEKTPITALACQALWDKTISGSDVPQNISQVVIGAVGAGCQLTTDKRIALISATGSCAMGKEVGTVVAGRFGKCLLELGGNNAIVVTKNADLDLAVQGVVFGVVGTAGQR